MKRVGIGRGVWISSEGELSLGMLELMPLLLRRVAVREMRGWRSLCKGLAYYKLQEISSNL